MSINFNSIIKDKIIETQTLSGGSIGRCFKVITAFSVFFVKYYQKQGLSEKEAHSLNEIKKCTLVNIPQVLSFDDHFIVLNFILQAKALPQYQSKLGVMLARLHKNVRSDQYGFYENNFIGSTQQINTQKDNWLDFFIENRLDFQIKLSNDVDLIKMWNLFYKRVPYIIGKTKEQPSFIHGDLWSGNIMTDNTGGPVLIDPAGYYAHREMEMGMTKMFGGFSEDFYTAYNKVFPLQQDWKNRLNIYMLYHVLNHYNMFGGGYKYQALKIMKSYL